MPRKFVRKVKKGVKDLNNSVKQRMKIVGDSWKKGKFVGDSWKKGKFVGDSLKGCLTVKKIIG